MNFVNVIRELFSLRLPGINWGSLGLPQDPSSLSNCKDAPSPDDSRESRNQYSINKIKFDNSVRIFASTVMLGVSFLIHWFGEPVNLSKIGLLFLIYCFTLAVFTIFLRKIPNVRFLDFLICSIDILGITWSIRLTGGLTSPFFFMYFLPLLIQSYHRDWGLILFYGFGGSVFYSFVIIISAGFLTPGQSFHLVSKIILMMTVVSIAILAVHLLRQKEDQEKRRLGRMKVLNHLSGVLNGLSRSAEVGMIIRNIVECLNREMGHEQKGWAQIFIVQESGDIMRSVMDPTNARFDTQQEISIKSYSALFQNRVMQIDDVEKEGGITIERLPFRSQVYVPIFGNFNEIFGLIFVGSEKPGAFREEDREFLEFIGRSLGITIQRLRTVDELRKAVEMDGCATAAFLSSTRNLKETFSSILDGVKNILKVQQASIMMWDGVLGRLVVREVIGPSAHVERKLEFQVGEGIPGRVFETGKPVWTSDIEHDEKFSAEKIPYKSLLCLPLFGVNGEPQGVVNAWSDDPVRTASPYEIDIAMTFVTRAAIALENARHKERQLGGEIDGERKEGQAA